MEKNELEQCKRFKQIRQELNIKQMDLARELAISQGHASDIENGRKAVSDRIIEILHLKYNVNEDWIKNGNGSMFVPLSRSETISSFLGSLMKDEDDSFRRRLVESLAELDSEGWEVLERIALDVLKKD